MDTKQKILLVDDEPAITDNLAPFLERSGFIVMTALNGIEALQRIARDKPDLLVMDVLNPKMDGRSASDPPFRNWIILLLTRSADQAKGMALEGADDYLNKPRSMNWCRIMRSCQVNRSAPISSEILSGPLSLDRRARRIYLLDVNFLNRSSIIPDL
jgi:DNA-binding response OmpR family regulator